LPSVYRRRCRKATTSSTSSCSARLFREPSCRSISPPQANILQASIMHRSLGATRTKAIEAMRDAYRAKSTMPIATFCRLLCFDTEEDAVAFAVHYGQDIVVCHAIVSLSPSSSIVELLNHVQKRSQCRC
jgi:hypothetical protein